METAQRLDQKKVYREPDGTTPVEVAAEQAGSRFRRLIVNMVIYARHIQHVRILFMMARMPCGERNSSSLSMTARMRVSCSRSVMENRRRRLWPAVSMQAMCSVRSL